MEAVKKEHINEILQQDFIDKNLEGYRSALKGNVEDADTFFEKLMEKYQNEPKV